MRIANVKLALGTAQFGLVYGIANQIGKVRRDEVARILNCASGYGIDMLDTAITYGESECQLGYSGVKNWKIVTKLPVIPNSCEDINAWVQEEIALSLLKLNVGELYGVLLHSSDQLCGKKGMELYKALQTLKDKGETKKIGISIYSPSELDILIPQYRFDLIQAPFNLIDRRLQTSGWLERLKYLDIEIHTRSTFLQGLLLMPLADIPMKFTNWNDIWNKWHNWLNNSSIKSIDACLAYPLSFSEIDRVIVGVESENQLQQIISSAQKTTLNDFPDICSVDENLINPSRWATL